MLGLALRVVILPVWFPLPAWCCRAARVFYAVERTAAQALLANGPRHQRISRGIDRDWIANSANLLAKSKTDARIERARIRGDGWAKTINALRVKID